jgi:hypothetical protein
VRDDKLMARRANIHLCVVENEVLEMDEFAADPHTGNGIKEVGPLGKAGPNLRSGDPLIKPGKRVLRGRYRPRRVSWFNLPISQVIDKARFRFHTEAIILFASVTPVIL